MKVEITEDKFLKYYQLQMSGEINMLDYKKGCEITGLSNEEWINIINNYRTYKEQYIKD